VGRQKSALKLLAAASLSYSPSLGYVEHSASRTYCRSEKWRATIAQGHIESLRKPATAKIMLTGTPGLDSGEFG
jgi:hypothetical protein